VRHFLSNYFDLLLPLLKNVVFSAASHSLTSSLPYLRCDDGLDEGEY